MAAIVTSASVDSGIAFAEHWVSMDMQMKARLGWVELYRKTGGSGLTCRRCGILWFVLLAVSCGGGRGEGGNPTVVLPPPEPITLLDTIPARGATVDPTTSGVNIVHVGAAGLQFTYSGGCGTTGAAVRRSLTDLSTENANHLIDHKLACEFADVSSYRVTVDALADDGRRYQGALEFSTRRGGGEPLTVLDHVVTPRSEIDELFVRYITDSLLDDIELHVLAVVVARIIGEIAERSWTELTARATYGVVAHSVSYPSRNPEGEPSLLTGLIAMPDVASASASAGSFERKDRVVILNHATGSTPGSLSSTGSGQLLANLIASRGYLVIAPDNWGRGGSAGDVTSGTDQPETYLMANRVANNTLDMVAAVMASDDYRMFHDPTQDADVSIVGYSQGGHSAVGVWLANQVGGTGLRVRELYSGGAPHNLYQTFRGSLQHLNDSCDGNPWCRNVGTETILHYLTDRILPPLLEYADIGLERSEVFEGDILASDFIAGVLDGDARYDTLKTMLQLNSFTNIINPAETIVAQDSRIHLYHSPFDRLVPQRNTRDLFDLLSSGFDVVFHDDECDSDLYELLFATISRGGVVHTLCGIEMFDEVLKDFRARDAATGNASLVAVGAPSTWASSSRWRSLTEPRATEAAKDLQALAEFRAGKSQEELQKLADLLREPGSQELSRVADLLSRAP